MSHWKQLLRHLGLGIILTAGLSVTAGQPPSSLGTATQPVSQVRSQPLPIVIAHRGASGYLPEHTAEAVVFAYALNSDYIEQDVVLSKDGHAVVLHDITLDEVTDVAEIFPDRRRDGHFYVFDFTLEELRQLTVHERKTSGRRRRFPHDRGRFRILTLTEELDLIQGLNSVRSGNTGIYVEVKQPAVHRQHGLDPSAVVLRILNEYGYADQQDRVFVQCFDAAEVRRLRTEMNCRLPLIQLFGRQPTAEQLMKTAQVADGIGVPIQAVVKADAGGKPVVTDLVSVARKNGLLVHVWTFRADDLPPLVSSSEQLLTLLMDKAGVDGIFTDHPDVVLARRSQQRGAAPAGPFRLLHGADQNK